MTVKPRSVFISSDTASGRYHPSQMRQPRAPAPAPVESGVQAEIGGPAAEARPGLAQMALAMARILNSKPVNQQPAEVKVLATLLDSCTKPGRPGQVATGP